MQATAARKAVESTFSDDKFIRRSSWNSEMIKAASYASQSPPPMVDTSDCVHKSTFSDDKFFRRSTWNADQINAAAYAALHPPPVVDASSYASQRHTLSGDDFFLRRSSYNAEQLNAAAYATIPAPPVVDVNNFPAPPPAGDDKFFRKASWHSNLQINANLPPNAYVQTVAQTLPERHVPVIVPGAC